MLPVDAVLRLLAENTLRRGCPVPVPRGAAYRWAEGAGLPRRAGYMLYTGCLYQLAPYIKKLSSRLGGLEDNRLAATLLGAARIAGRLFSLAGLVGRPDEGEVRRSTGILRSISALLRRSGVDLGYLYEDDLYSGVLLYDMGLDEAFAEHASRVHEALRRRASRIVTVDPHTHVVLSMVYPRFVDSFDLEVYSYLELIDPDILGAAGEAGNTEYVVHDPCLYARAADLHVRARELLRRAGVRYRDPPHSGRNTMCCGGPVESIAPRLARSIAGARLSELLGVSDRIIVMCPLCYVNLSLASRGHALFRDIAELLGEAAGIDEG